MDHLEVLREKVGRLRAEIAEIHELNQAYRLRQSKGIQDQVDHGDRHERLQAIQQELGQVLDLGRRVVSVEKMREKSRDRVEGVRQARAS